MSVTLSINGSLGLTFLNEVKQVVSAEQQKDIETNLQSGDYVISLSEKKVHKLDDFEFVCYFDFEVYEDTEYEFIIEN